MHHQEDNHNHNQQGLASPAEVCKYLRLSRQTVWRMARRGELCPVKIGPRTIRFRWTDLHQIAQGGAK